MIIVSIHVDDWNRVSPIVFKVDRSYEDWIEAVRFERWSTTFEIRLRNNADAFRELLTDMGIEYKCTKG